MERDIYDYASEIDGNEHVSFYEVFRVLLRDIDCIVCKKSVADLLGYSNGGFRKNIEVYTTKDYNLPYLKCHIVDDLSKINYQKFHELKVVPIEKTIVDLLRDDKSDQQILLESMANYFYEHNESFIGINPPSSLVKKFKFYSEEGKKYYDTY